MVKEREKKNTWSPEKIWAQGIEEMNLTEFPLAVLSREQPEGIKTLEFSDQLFDRSIGEYIKRKVTITGSDKWGLPTALDMDVFLALKKLTNDKNRFRDRTVKFSLYELRRLLRWPPDRHYKQRLKLALKRLLGVTVAYENAFRKRAKNGEQGKWVSLEGFHLIDNVRLTNTVEEYDPDEEQLFKWNDVIVESVQNGNTKGLNWDFYLGLKTPTSKRLYRFLDKRFNNKYRSNWKFDLESFCRNKMGFVGDTYRVTDFKKKLRPAIAELVEAGFLRGQDEKKRYHRERKGVFKVEFARPYSRKSVEKQPAREPSGLEKELLERGVGNAAELVENFPAEKIREQIKNIDHRNKHGENRGGGYLRMAIEQPNGYGFRHDYVSNDELAARKKAKEERELANKTREAALIAQQKREDAAKREAVENYMASLAGDDEREAFFEEALSNSNKFAQKHYAKAKKENRADKIQMWRSNILETHIATLEAAGQ